VHAGNPAAERLAPRLRADDFAFGGSTVVVQNNPSKRQLSANDESELPAVDRSRCIEFALSMGNCLYSNSKK
jgi:hypothetical protein